MINLNIFVKVVMGDGSVKYGRYQRKMQNNFDYYDQAIEKLKIKQEIVWIYGVRDEDINFITKEQYDEEVSK